MEDYTRSYDIDGIMWGSERHGALGTALGASHGGARSDPGRVGCFCEFCEEKARQQGIVQFDRVKEGYRTLEKYVRAARAGERPVDGHYVTFWRILMRYPEILAWEQFFHDGLREIYAGMHEKAHSIKPNIEVGWHIWHNNSFSAFYRAQQDLSRLEDSSDFLKMVMYHNCGGERMASYIDSMCGDIYGDMPKQDALEFDYHVMNFKERSYEEIPFTGLSADYVYREAKRSMDGAAGTNIKIWPGIDIDIPTARTTEEHSSGHEGCSARGLQGGSARRDSVTQILGDEAREPRRRRRRDSRTETVMTRRDFIGTAAAAVSATAAAQGVADTPWYRRTYRRGQTNITEKDPVRYDIPWWREYWKRTEVQGVIINAGGIVAYYPSKFPLQHRAEFLGNRDLYGELCKAAHDDGLAVLARMDSNRTSEDFFRAHPDWFARDINGHPYRAANKYVTCVNSPYYDEYIPGVLREIIERSHPEGLTDNSWSGLGRSSICYCGNCTRKFREKTGHALPKAHDWSDKAYRDWIEWNYARRLEVWDLNNRMTKAAGGPNCLWIGMNSGSIPSQSRSFRDCKAIWERAEILMLDHQARGPAGFQENSDAGKLIHGIMGWDKVIPESMAMYQAGSRPSFRLASKPAAEARMWMIEGFAGGIQPWWHHVGAYHEDRRMYKTAEPMMRFYKENERYLVNRKPLATIGVVWSQRNTDFYGHNEAAELVELPYHGFMQAFIRARIPYVPIHIDRIDRDSADLKALVLPNIAAMSDAQCSAVKKFVQRGGSVVATGVTSLYDEWGDPRSDFGLADLFGAHWTGAAGVERKWAAQAIHTYLRLSPELRARVWGPETGDEPVPSGQRHPVLTGFDETDILPFGGMLADLKVDAGVTIPLTFIPEFPIYPPETAWMRQPKTDIPGLILNGRVAYMPADIDRRFGRDRLPDHGDLLRNLVRWAAAGSIPLEVEGHGLADCNLYTQPGRVIMHLVNLASTSSGRAPIDEYIPIGPLLVRLQLPKDVRGANVRKLVAGASGKAEVNNGWVLFDSGSIADHEVFVIE